MTEFDAILEKLSQHARSQMELAEANRKLAEAEKEKANEYARLRLAEERRTTLILLQTEQAGTLINQVRRMLEYLGQAEIGDGALRDWFTILSTRFERIERGLILLLSAGNQREKKQLLEELESSQPENQKVHLKQQLLQYRRNLQQLELQLSQMGEIEAPIGLLNQLDNTRQMIEKLEAQLTGYG